MRDARVDENQALIVQVLRRVGATVKDTHTLGSGFTDIAVLFHGAVHLMEIKMPGGKLTPGEQEFHDVWGGSPFVHIVHSAEEALKAIGVEFGA